jgi:hypothetical protein
MWNPRSGILTPLAEKWQWERAMLIKYRILTLISSCFPSHRFFFQVYWARISCHSVQYGIGYRGFVDVFVQFGYRQLRYDEDRFPVHRV